MWKWFAKKVAKATEEIEAEKKNKEAYELGQKAASDFLAELETYTGPRFAILQKNYMKVFRDRLDLAEKDQEVPPLVSVRVEHRVFLENIKKFKPELVEQICAAHESWMKLWAQMGNEDEMRAAIQKKVDGCMFGMFEASFTELLSRVDYLKPLDERWRIENPEKSALYPPPN